MVFKWTSWYFSTYHFWEVLASRLHRSLDRLQTPDSSTVPTKQNVVRHGEKVKLESDGQLWANAKQTKRRAVNALIHSFTHSRLRLDAVLQSVLCLSTQTQAAETSKCCWAPQSSGWTEESRQDEEVLQAASRCAAPAALLTLTQRGI